MNKIACFTLDVERDYGQERIRGRYLIDELLVEEDRFKRLFDPLEIKLTAFIVGELIEETPEIVDSLNAANAELGLHSYSHEMDRDRILDIEKGVKVFDDVVGRRPIGYRAPQGVLNSDEVCCLDEYGFKYDSSVFPFIRFGKYCNLTSPREPYVIEGSSLLELPFASVPVVRFPIALSYMMFFGWELYEALFKVFGMPSILVFDFHLHDLFPPESYYHLSSLWRAFYSTVYRRNPWMYFVRFVDLLRSEGYTFLFMEELYNQVLKEKSMAHSLFAKSYAERVYTV
ncbi:MAG: polysaccharide deacetylase family protein [Candidatus Odinarchaeia archaeon]